MNEELIHPPTWMDPDNYAKRKKPTSKGHVQYDSILYSILEERKWQKWPGMRQRGEITKGWHKGSITVENDLIGVIETEARWQQFEENRERRKLKNAYNSCKRLNCEEEKDVMLLQG